MNEFGYNINFYYLQIKITGISFYEEKQQKMV
jgi:hypothetical protein